ncbi:response regulator transcription factor [Paenibacillus sp. GXUN7292]|uniref:response regulator transcription factor n=1 Tax=Paenibacillus sp. GXUN7292 TaxID=3422499 RepID=UPI003D7E5C02
MRKVMIVDDESLVRIGLQSMIDWESRGYRIEGVFKNGAEALEAAKREHYDIVLTDIKMPGMGGLELISHLRQVSPSTSVIILSSYNDFEYTRKAIQLGVKDYISKYQIEPEELFRVLDSLNVSYHEAGAVSRPDAAGALSSLEAEKARLLVESRQPDACFEYPLLSAWMDKLHASSCRWIMIEPLERQDGYENGEIRVLSLLIAEMFARIKNPIFLGEDKGRLHGLLAVAETPFTTEVLEEMTTEWCATSHEKLNIKIAVFWSSPRSIKDGWHEARSAALQLSRLTFHKEASWMIEDLYPVPRSFEHEEWLELHQLIRKRIAFYQFHELAADLQQHLDEGKHIEPEEWLRLYKQAAHQLSDHLLNDCRIATEYIETFFKGLWPLPDYISKVKSSTQLLRHFSQMTAAAEQYTQSGANTAVWIAKVNEYVANHYASLRLEDVAEHVHLSVNYFSQKFRQETGEAFIDYLTRIRIQEAIKLFRSTSLSTEEIAEQVGYMNANYFTKVFKKVTGQTIKHFKLK